MDNAPLLKETIGRARSGNPSRLLWQGRYWDLDSVLRWAARIAATLPHRGDAGRPGLVAIIGPPSPQTVAAVYGVLWAGHAYTVLEPETPPAILQTTGSQGQFIAILADPNVPAEALDALGMPETRQIGLTAIQEEVTPAPPAFCAPQNAAYVLFTSGSTGLPKGACVSHETAALAQALYRQELGLGDSDVIANETLFSFDVSTFDIFSLAVAGGLALPPRTAIGEDPAAFLAHLRDASAQMTFTVPSVAAALLDHLVVTGATPPPGLRTLALTGEPMTRSLAGRIAGMLPEGGFNLFGQSEAPYLLASRLTAEDDPNTFPLPRRPVRVGLRSDGGIVPAAEAPPGTRGELEIAGPALFNGYLGESRDALAGRRQAARTFGDLFEITPNRHLRFLGRRERTTSVWGVTVFLDAVEDLIGRCPGVAAAAVIADDEGIRAFVEPLAGGAPLRLEAVQAVAATHLDRYQWPRTWTLMPRLPRRPNGKIARRDLEGR